MRHHDIEKLKEAARRYKSDCKCLCDMEELVDYAIDKLDEPSGEHVTRITNGNGTETWYGLPVVVPVGLIPEGEVPVEVRSYCLPMPKRFLHGGGDVCAPNLHHTHDTAGRLAILLADKPAPITWTPPASLPDGEYHFVATEMVFFGNGDHYRRSSYKDWTEPPRLGRYKVENGTATWIGE